MDYKKVLEGLLSTAYKMDSGKIAELLQDGGDEAAASAAILEADRERIKPFAGKFQEGYNKAKKEEREAFEAEIKTKYGVESDLKGLELIEHIASLQTGENSGGDKPRDMTEDEIKRTKVYQDAERTWKKAVTDKETEWKTKLEEVEKDTQKKSALQTVNAAALKILAGLNPVLPKTEAVAETHRQLFLNALANGYEFDISDPQNILVMKDGKVLDDGHGHTLPFAKFISDQAANHFEFAANNGGENGGNNNDKEEQGGTKTGADGKTPYPTSVTTKPKTLEELQLIVNRGDLKPAEKRVVIDTFEAETAAK